MAWGWRVLAVGAWIGVACGDDPAENVSASTSGNDDDDDDDDDAQDESEDDDPVVEDGSSTADPDSSGSSSGSPASSSTGESESSGSSTGSSDGSSSGSSTEDGTDTDPTGPVGECDPFEQDCAPGEKCSAWADDGGNSWNATKCVPVDDDPVQPGEPCVVDGSGVSGVDNCDLGAMCWDVDFETGMGTCVALCTGSADDPACADAATSCQLSNGGVLNLCLENCNPLLDECDAGQGCYPGSIAFHCSADASGGGGGQGDECMFLNACDPGLACLLGDFVGCSDRACCSAYCDASDPLACTDAGLFCYAFFPKGAAPPGFEDVGVCGT